MSPTLDQILDDIRKKPVVPIWPHVAIALGLSRCGAYDAAKRGDFEIIRVGRLKKAVTAPLRRKLGIEAA